METTIIIAVLLLITYVTAKYLFVKYVFYPKYAKSLVFFLVKIAKKESDLDSKSDNIQSMKSNIQVMTQIYKNFYSIYAWGWFFKWIWNKWISLNIIIEKEQIKFIVWVPYDFKESFEKTISSFYPGCLVEDIKKPKLLEAGKYGYGWYFVLSKDDAYPIKDFEKFEVDPLDSIFSAFSRVQYDEKLFLQILISPLSEKWQKSLRKKAELLKKWGGGSIIKKLMNFSQADNKKEEKNSNFSSTQTQDIEAKVQDEWFEICIKSYSTSPDDKRPQSIIEDLKRLFNQFNYIGLNSFVFLPLTNFTKFSKEFVSNIFKRPVFTLKKWLYIIRAQVLNIKELSTIYHFPHSRFNKNPRIKWQNFKIVPAPDFLPTEWILLWTNVYSWVKKEVRLQQVDRFRHFYYIWQTGTWKSSLILLQAKQDLAQWNWFCIIDPHGDLCEFIVKHYPKDRIDDLIYFDAWNTNYPYGLNLLEIRKTEDMDIISDDAVEMFIKMYWPEIFGPRIQDYFRNWVYTLMEQPEGWNLCEIMRLFTDEAYQKLKLRNVKNAVIRAWWEKTYKSMWDREKWEIIPYFQAKFGPLTTNAIVRNIIWQTESSFNIDEIMQKKKVLLVNLSKWKIWEMNSQLLWLIFVSKMKSAALRRAQLPADQRSDFFLYIDEFQNFVTPSIETILSEARKYRLWLVLTHQYIDQLQKKDLGGETDLKWAIFGNVWSLMAFKVWAKDGEFLEQEFSPEFSRSDLVNIDTRMWIMKLSVNSQPTRPFSINVWNPYTDPLNDAKKVEIIKKISMLKYGRKKDLVEKEIFYRIGG